MQWWIQTRAKSVGWDIGKVLRDGREQSSLHIKKNNLMPRAYNRVPTWIKNVGLLKTMHWKEIRLTDIIDRSMKSRQSGFWSVMVVNFPSISLWLFLSSKLICSFLRSQVCVMWVTANLNYCLWNKKKSWSLITACIETFEVAILPETFNDFQIHWASMSFLVLVCG